MFALQFEGCFKAELVLEGELRSEGHELGPGATLTVVAVNERMQMPGIDVGSKAYLIHLPDAPKVMPTSKKGKRF